MHNPYKGEQAQDNITPNKIQFNKQHFDSETYESSKKDININTSENKKSIDFFPTKINIDKIDESPEVHRKYTVEKKLIIKDFVPQIRPIEIHVVPSKLRLNKKGFKDLKCNKNNKILLNSNKYFISCPNSDEDDDSEKFESSKENQSSSNIIKIDKISKSLFNIDIDIKGTRKNLQKTKNKNIPKVHSKNNFPIKGKYNNDLNLGISSDSDLYDIDEIDNYSLITYENENKEDDKKENIGGNEKNNKRNRTRSFTILENIFFVMVKEKKMIKKIIYILNHI